MVMAWLKDFRRKKEQEPQFTPPPRRGLDGNNDEQNMWLLHMRLHTQEGMRMPFDHINAYATKYCAYVFVVTNGKAIVLEDDPALFPSDKLIAELQLLMV